jgi:hypothetical protein
MKNKVNLKMQLRVNKKESSVVAIFLSSLHSNKEAMGFYFSCYHCILGLMLGLNLGPCAY